jgi:hypothetical protein
MHKEIIDAGCCERGYAVLYSTMIDTGDSFELHRALLLVLQQRQTLREPNPEGFVPLHSSV